METVEPSQKTAVISPTEPHTATVIFIHGQNTFTWRAMIQEGLVPGLPQVEWILPQASNKIVTLDQGMLEPSWFNIATLPPGDDEFDEPAIAENIGIIEKLILAQIHRGVDSRKIILVGFSQGAALSLMTIGGVASLSGWIPPRARDQTIASPSVPILWCHGLVDNLIPIEHAEDAVAYLEQNIKGEIQFHKYPGLAHTINDRVVEDLLAWLKSIVLG
ncbi:phospholipase carboxylesterase [Mycena amicta]|nr:phospholipase carboxylesterase [Mycena amicta]